MVNTRKKYRYNLWPALLRVLIFGGLLGVVLTFKSWEEPVENYLLATLLAGGVVFFWQYGSKIFTYNFFTDNSLRIVRPLRSELIIPFENIARVTIEESPGTVGKNIVTVRFKRHKGHTLRLDVTYLKERTEFFTELEAHAGNYRVIYQDRAGAIIRSV